MDNFSLTSTHYLQGLRWFFILGGVSLHPARVSLRPPSLGGTNKKTTRESGCDIIISNLDASCSPVPFGLLPQGHQIKNHP